MGPRWKRNEKNASLTHTYYRSFLLLIVIPLVLVFMVAEIVIGYLIRNASIETIDAVQENIATALSNDVRTNALQLSHFVYINGGEFTRSRRRSTTARAARGMRRTSSCKGPSEPRWFPPRTLWPAAFT